MRSNVLASTIVLALALAGSTYFNKQTFSGQEPKSQEEKISNAAIVCCNEAVRVPETPEHQLGTDHAAPCRDWIQKHPEWVKGICEQLKSVDRVCPEMAIDCGVIKSPKCEEEHNPPWFDTNAQCHPKTMMLPPQPSIRVTTGIVGVECSITYTVCFTWGPSTKSEFFPISFLSTVLNRPMSQEEAEKFCASKGYTADNVPVRPVCCETWKKAHLDWLAYVKKNGRDSPNQPCSPVIDADCDGIPNNDDPTPLGRCAMYPPPGSPLYK